MSPRRIRCLVLAALVLPAVLLLSPAQAQLRGPRIPTPPRPTMPGPIQHKWVCSGCGAVVGTGPFKPMIDHCPSCGAHFRNGIPGGININPPPGWGPPAEQPPAEQPPAEQPPPPEQNWPVNDNNPAPAAANAAPAPTQAGGSNIGRTLLIVGAVGGGVLLLFAALGMILYATASRAAKEEKPRRRKRVYHDED